MKKTKMENIDLQQVQNAINFVIHHPDKWFETYAKNSNLKEIAPEFEDALETQNSDVKITKRDIGMLCIINDFLLSNGYKPEECFGVGLNKNGNGYKYEGVYQYKHMKNTKGNNVNEL